MNGWPDFAPASDTTNGGWGAPPTSCNPPISDAPPPSPVPKAPKVSTRMRLHSVNDVQRELRRLYVEARNGTLKAADATKLAYLLNMLANLMIDTDLEERVNAALAQGSGK